MTPFDTYRMYVAIKLHFTSDYDYFKYNGKTRVKESQFDVRKDKYFFHKLSKKPDLELFLANAFFIKDNVWVGDLFNESYQEAYNESLKTIQSLEYSIKNFQTLKNFESYDDLINEGEMYWVYRNEDISKEVLIVINNYLKFFSYWDKIIDPQIIWQEDKNKLLKFEPFIDYDVKKINNTLFTLFKQ